ncbi:MAG: RDD family protein [Gaiellaceae bacterium]
MSVVGATYRLMASVATPTARRTLDELFAGPFPEMLGRALREHAVLERVATEYADGTPLDERARELLRHPDVQNLIVDAVAMPVARRVLAEESASFSSYVTTTIRDRAHAADIRVESAPRRWFGRSAADARSAGLATRGLAFVVDGLIVGVVLLLAAAALGVATALAGPLRPGWLAGVGLGATWFVAQAVYFAAFWSTVGQTPGMRLVRVRVVSASPRPLGLGRALLRFGALIVSIIPCFAGFAPALFDNRRRALPDYVARTVVVTTEPN